MARSNTVDCKDIAELFPVYLNQSLDAVAVRRVEAHLTTCAACRQEERDTRAAWDLYEGHLPVELLLDYALAQPMAARRVAVVESHLAACERCSEEVATVRRETVRREDEPQSQSPSGATPASCIPRSADQAQVRLASPWLSRGGPRTLAWAACLATVIASAGWFWTWRQLVDERTASSAQTVRSNLPVVELLPAMPTALRQGGAERGATTNRVELPADASELVLVLLSGGRSCGSGCVLEIYGTGDMLRLPPSEGTPPRRVEGLVPNSDGHLTLFCPSDWLFANRSLLVVSDQASGERLVEFLVEVSDGP